jgi:hypothetical protein
MLAVKGIYNKGKIELLEPLPSFIKTAELNIIVISEDEQKKIGIAPGKFRETVQDGEEDFRRIGKHYFFNEDEDADVDWEDFFYLKDK